MMFRLWTLMKDYPEILYTFSVSCPLTPWWVITSSQGKQRQTPLNSYWLPGSLLVVFYISICHYVQFIGTFNELQNDLPKIPCSKQKPSQQSHTRFPFSPVQHSLEHVAHTREQLFLCSSVHKQAFCPPSAESQTEVLQARKKGLLDL